MPGLNLTAAWGPIELTPGFIIDNWPLWVSLLVAVIALLYTKILGQRTDQNVNEKSEQIKKMLECIIDQRVKKLL